VTAAAAGLAALALLLLAPLVIAVARHRTLASMALRNIRRRRAEALLVVAGALLGTAIITSSFVVGDVVEGSFADVARTRYGPVDLTVTLVGDVERDEVATTLAAAKIAEVDGVLAATTATATLEVAAEGMAVPQVSVVELDLAAARGFGADAAITGLANADTVGDGQILLNEDTAARLDVQPGETIRVHAYGAHLDAVVSDVVAEVGLAGYGGAIVAPGTIDRLVDEAALTGLPPQQHLLVSAAGGVFDTRVPSATAVASIRTALDGLPVEVEATKTALLDAAEQEAGGLAQIFTMFGSFSVLAGVLLLVNLFVMMAEERKTELGMLRAVGFTRRRLTRAFAVEGAIYAIAASAAGAVAGIGIGWVVAIVAAPIFGPEGAGFPLVVEPASLAVGATAGLVISLVTIWATSIRIARLNIIRAIRDLPEPKVARVGRRSLALGAFGILLGITATGLGYASQAVVPLLVGVPVAAFSASPLLRRFLPERAARSVGAGIVLAWGLSAYALFKGIVGTADMTVFVVQGVVLTAGAVALASSLDRVWTHLIELLGRRGRGLAPRLGLAYPLAHRFRTSMLLGMFSLVVFTVTILTVVTAAMGRNTDTTVAQLAGGFDVLLDVNPTSPIDDGALVAHDDIATAAGVTRGIASFGAEHLDAPRAWGVSGFDEALVEGGPPTLVARDDAFPSDAQAYRAVLLDPALVIVPQDFLVGGVEEGTLQVGDTFTAKEPGNAQTHPLTIVGLTGPDVLGSGALVSRSLAATLLGGHSVVSRYYLDVAEPLAASDVASALNSTFLTEGADARTFTSLGAQLLGALTGFIALLRGFLGLGLLVGIAGLGVVMVRAVRERRREIGMLRAIGFRARLVQMAMLSEAGLIAAQGTLIGATLGLVTARQMLAASDSFGDAGVPFSVPWPGLVLILALPLVASLAAAARPASRAAAIRPAVALRTAD
jgi:putative ABC transport system permease protein